MLQNLTLTCSLIFPQINIKQLKQPTFIHSLTHLITITIHRKVLFFIFIYKLYGQVNNFRFVYYPQQQNNKRKITKTNKFKYNNNNQQIE